MLILLSGSCCGYYPLATVFALEGGPNFPIFCKLCTLLMSYWTLWMVQWILLFSIEEGQFLFYYAHSCLDSNFKL